MFSVPSAARLSASKRPVHLALARAAPQRRQLGLPGCRAEVSSICRSLDGLVVRLEPVDADHDPLLGFHLALILVAGRRRSRSAESRARSPESSRPFRRCAGCNRLARASRSPASAFRGNSCRPADRGTRPRRFHRRSPAASAARSSRRARSAARTPRPANWCAATGSAQHRGHRLERRPHDVVLRLLPGERAARPSARETAASGCARPWRRSGRASTCAQILRAARYLAISSKKSLCALKKKLRRGANSSTGQAALERPVDVLDAVAQRERQFLHRGRSGFADVIAADRNRIEARDVCRAPNSIVSVTRRIDGRGG